MNQVVISFVLALLISSTKADGPEALAAGAIPGIGAGFGGGLGGGLGGAFPGFGFQKNLDISGGAGFGPFLGGLGGVVGGVPPIDGVVPEGGLPPIGLIGPSYIPSTWLGSALGAKGDLLFPIVLFVFFVVGVWTIIQFLLGLIVPLIAAKFAVLEGATAATEAEHNLWRRDAPMSPQQEKENQINQLTNVVMAAIENVGCMKMMACQSGNFIHSIAGEKLKDYNGPMEAMKSMSPEMSEIFKKAALTGKEDCSVFECHSFATDSKSVHGQQNVNDQQNHVPV